MPVDAPEATSDWLFAVIRPRHAAKVSDFIVRLYDKRMPLDTRAGDPCARYEHLTTLGPFDTELEAAREAKRARA